MNYNDVEREKTVDVPFKLPEANERDAAGQESGSERNQSFEAVVHNREPLQVDAASNVVRSIHDARMVHRLSIGARCVQHLIWYSSAAISDRGPVGAMTDFRRRELTIHAQTDHRHRASGSPRRQPCHSGGGGPSSR